jgi:hypothetical protein
MSQVWEDKRIGNLEMASNTLMQFLRRLGSLDERWSDLEEDKDAEEFLQAILLFVRSESTLALEAVDPATSHFCRAGFCLW